MMSRRARFWRLNLAAFHQFQSHFLNRPINIYRPPEFRHNHRLNAQTLLRRLYSATTNARASQSQPQLSLDLINIMEQKLSAIEDRHSHLLAILNQPDASPEEYSTANKEVKKLRHTIDVVAELRNKQQEIEGLKSLIDEAQEDKDMREMAAEELEQASQEEERLHYMLLKSLLTKDDADERDSILEVRAGTGGEEASLFAMEIFKMYEKYSRKKGWKFEVLGVAESDLKGYKEAISGADVYGKLKFESGIHRVQVTGIVLRSSSKAGSMAKALQQLIITSGIRARDCYGTRRSGGSPFSQNFRRACGRRSQTASKRLTDYTSLTSVKLVNCTIVQMNLTNIFCLNAVSLELFGMELKIGSGSRGAFHPLPWQ